MQCKHRPSEQRPLLCFPYLIPGEFGRRNEPPLLAVCTDRKRGGQRALCIVGLRPRSPYRPGVIAATKVAVGEASARAIARARVRKAHHQHNAQMWTSHRHRCVGCTGTCSDSVECHGLRLALVLCFPFPSLWPPPGSVDGKARLFSFVFFKIWSAICRRGATCTVMGSSLLVGLLARRSILRFLH